MTQSLQGKYRPKEYADIIGNHEAIETILSHVADNGGSYMGLAFLLLGKSGQGKGMLSELMINHCEQLIGGDVNVVYADTFSSEDFTKKIAQWESECCEQGCVFGNMRTYTVFIFDEFNAVNRQDAWAAFKLAYDRIERHRLAGNPCRAFAIFTTAKVKEEDLTAGLKREWTECTRRMKRAKIGIDPIEYNAYFAAVTDGLIAAPESEAAVDLLGDKMSPPAAPHRQLVLFDKAEYVRIQPHYDKLVKYIFR